MEKKKMQENNIGKIKNTLILAIKNANFFPAIKVLTRKILTAFSAIVLFMPWEISAEEISDIQKKE